MTFDGTIIKGIGGFYYVETADNRVYECKLRGIFRKNKITPLPGDRVEISVNEGEENTVDKVLERKSELKRPPVANVDVMLIVVASTQPKPNTVVIDKLTVIAEAANIVPVFIFTKNDIQSCDDIFEIYKTTGYKCIKADYETGSGLEEIRNIINGKICVLAGNTGVGKSTLLNALDSTLNLKTGEISEKLGRGRHTTRHVEFFKLCGGYIADTPGFSSVDFEITESFLKESIQYLFKEFDPYIGTCKFTGCAHINDKGCKIREAAENGKVSQSRYNSYVEIYNEVKDIKEWQL